MMEDVPENEWQNSPPALREENGQLPAPRPPNAPAELDPEQVRQFQQFQQFQELMRQQGSGLVPPPPTPLWKKALTSKGVRKLALIAIVALLGYFAYDYYFGSSNDDLPASMTGGGKTQTNQVLPTNPYETVRKVYERIAYDDPQVACGMFDERTGAPDQFANSFNATDCAQAVSALHKDVTGRNGYAEVDFKGKMGQTPDSGVVDINSCDLGVSNGPRLGLFTVNRIDKDQWIITAYRSVTCP